MRDILRGCPETGVACTEQNRRHPEVVTVVSQLGRPDDGTDVTGFSNIEFFAPLKPFDEWRHGQTKEELTDELQAELAAAFPGAIFNFSQYISDNVEEAVAGVKGENSVKVFGPNLKDNEKNAGANRRGDENVPGIKDLGRLPVARATQHQDHARSPGARPLRPQHRRRRRGRSRPPSAGRP